jgi:hypothetical protein
MTTHFSLQYPSLIVLVDHVYMSGQEALYKKLI